VKFLNIVNPGSFGISTLHELNRAVTDLLQCTVKYFINTIFDSVRINVAGICIYFSQSVTN
jgi:hypothetical protein